jgi:16S rRNA processing protein RimM
MTGSDVFVVGHVAGAHGIRGEVVIHLHDGTDRELTKGDPIHLSLPGKPPASYRIISARPHKGRYIVALDDVADRNHAETLAGAAVIVARSSLPALEDDEYYWEDLIGLAVYSIDASYLGALTAVFRTGSNDVYVVRNGDDEILIPALAWVVVAVDVDAGTMTVDLPEGL